MDDHSSVVGLGPSVLVASSHQILLAPRVQMLKWKLREVQEPTQGWDRAGVNAGVKRIPPPPPHLRRLDSSRAWARSSGGFVSCVCWKGSVCGVVCAGCCDVLAPSPPTCPRGKGFRGCLHGDGEPRRKDFAGHSIPPQPWFNKSGAGGEGYHATCQLHRHNLE